jgi:hypothetical protein
MIIVIIQDVDGYIQSLLKWKLKCDRVLSLSKNFGKKLENNMKFSIEKII